MEVLEEFFFVYVLDPELYVGDAPVVVLGYGIADVHRVAGMQVLEVLGPVERYGRDIAVRLVLLYELQFHVAVAGADQPSVAVVVDILSDEHRRLIAGPKGLELLEYAEELWA